MKRSYQFSVIIPTYNCAQYLPKALDSIIAQGELFNDCQVIVVDDGSTDDTYKVCQSYCQRHPQNIFFTRKTNGNWGSVVNYVKLNKLARGRLITVLDADDWYEPTIFAEVSRYADKDMIVTDFYCFGRHNKQKRIGVYFSRFATNPLFSNKFNVRTPHSQPIGKFYSYRVFYLLRDLQEKKWYQDCIMYHMGVGIATEIQYINKPLAVWNNRRPGNSTTTVWSNNKKFNDWCSTLRLMNKHGAGLATYIYTLLPGFIKELKLRDKIIVLTEKPKNNWMPKIPGFLFGIWIYLRVHKYIKNVVNKRG